MDPIKQNVSRLQATKVTLCLDAKSTTMLFPNRTEHNLAYLETSSPRQCEVYEKGNESTTLLQPLFLSRSLLDEKVLSIILMDQQIKGDHFTSNT